jgi:C-methyltransferase C-terminal domain/Putative zinc binding domain/Methyltransferase domain
MTIDYRQAGETKSCSGCKLTGLTIILDLGSSPLADRFRLPNDRTPETRYPLQLAVCDHCSLAQLTHHVPDEELYGADYGFFTGSSPSSVTYFKTFAGWAEQQHQSDTRQIVEIACNDGTLLENFRNSPLLGVEPAGPPAEAARAKGLTVEEIRFTEDSAEMLLNQYGKAGLVIGCNVMAHVPDPLDFLRGIRLMLAKDGIAVLEFQAFDDLVADCQFDLVYHEHRFFFSLQSFAHVAKMAGLNLLSYIRTSAQGGSLRVTLGRQQGIEVEPDSDLLSMLPGLQARACHIRDRLLETIDEFDVVAGYGASAKSATLLNFCGLTADAIQWITDLTPYKLGKFTPGSHIPITDKQLNPDAYLMLVRNYLPSVLRRERDYLDQGGHFIVPIPNPVVI